MKLALWLTRVAWDHLPKGVAVYLILAAIAAHME